MIEELRTLRDQAEMVKLASLGLVEVDGDERENGLHLISRTARELQAGLLELKGRE